MMRKLDMKSYSYKKNILEVVPHIHDDNSSPFLFDYYFWFSKSVLDFLYQNPIISKYFCCPQRFEIMRVDCTNSPCHATENKMNAPQKSGIYF